MELSTVSCNKCGAALQVPDTARFITCRYCGAQLEVKRTESIISTEVLDRIDRHTADMAEDLSAIRRETELERLDREWTVQRDGFMIRNKNGDATKPTAAGGIAIMIIFGGFGLLWTIITFCAAFSTGAPGFVFLFPIFGLGFIAVAIIGGLSSISSAQAYSQAEHEYLQRRTQLLSRSHDRPTTRV